MVVRDRSLIEHDLPFADGKDRLLDHRRRDDLHVGLSPAGGSCR
jgi:hypothetical protein